MEETAPGIEVECEQRNNEDLEALETLKDLTWTYLQQGQSEQVEGLYKEVAEKQTSVLGAEHPDTLSTLNNPAFVYSMKGRDVKEGSVHEQLLEKIIRTFGEEHLAVFVTVNLAHIWAARSS